MPNRPATRRAPVACPDCGTPAAELVASNKQLQATIYVWFRRGVHYITVSCECKSAIRVHVDPVYGIIGITLRNTPLTHKVVDTQVSPVRSGGGREKIEQWICLLCNTEVDIMEAEKVVIHQRHDYSYTDTRQVEGADHRITHVTTPIEGALMRVSRQGLAHKACVDSHMTDQGVLGQAVVESTTSYDADIIVEPLSRYLERKNVPVGTFNPVRITR